MRPWAHAVVLSAMLSQAACKPSDTESVRENRVEVKPHAVPKISTYYERPSPEEEVMQTIFGDHRGKPMRVGTADVVFGDGRLLNTSKATVFIASGTTVGAGHGEGGYLGLWYLERRGNAFAVLSAFPGFVHAGTFGNPPSWTVRTDLGPDEVIVAEGFGQWFGHAYTCTTLVALGRNRPRMMAPPILTGYQFDPGDDPAEVEPAEDIKGVVHFDGSSNSLVITYSGTVKEEVRYRQLGSSFRPPHLRRELHRC